MSTPSPSTPTAFPASGGTLSVAATAVKAAKLVKAKAPKGPALLLRG